MELFGAMKVWEILPQIMGIFTFVSSITLLTHRFLAQRFDFVNSYRNDIKEGYKRLVQKYNGNRRQFIPLYSFPLTVL